MLRKRSHCLLSDNVNIGRIDAAAPVNVHSEVGRIGVLKTLLPYFVNIGRVDPAARVDIAQKHTH